MTAPSALIVGAGMAGIVAARDLARAGWTPIVVDKGRVLGGRMSTRRHDGARFDHGAQHFSARSEAFAHEVAALVEAGVVHRWYEGASLTRPELGLEPRWAGRDGMRQVVGALAEGLDVRTGARVTRLDHGPQGWTALTDAGPVASGAALVLTPPLPQTLELLAASGIEPSPDHAATLAGVRYGATLAVLALLDGPSGLVDGHAALGEGEWPVAWLADNHHKGVSGRPAVTIHSTEQFAAANLEAEVEDWKPQLVAAAEAHLEAEVVSTVSHRWRFARPIDPLDSGVLVIDPARSLLLAGEAFAGAKVEGAYLSGRAAARHLLHPL